MYAIVMPAFGRTKASQNTYPELLTSGYPCCQDGTPGSKPCKIHFYYYDRIKGPTRKEAVAKPEAHACELEDHGAESLRPQLAIERPSKRTSESSQPTGTVYQTPTKRYVILMLMSSIY
ncbi:hypothetical protein BDR04DRAFT_1086071 [Suillus decipiens]|nr:hypothetical protein BDR04DRAFT_1086071 [Suillus decipiens]